jgi:hypothetical protein
MAALVRSWGLSSPKARVELAKKAASKITYAQQRNAKARKSHWKRTLQRLKLLGVDLSELKRCEWDMT